MSSFGGQGNTFDERPKVHPSVVWSVAATLTREAPTIDPETIPIVRQLREELARVTAERDAAVSFIPKTCDTCKHGKSPCDWCWADPDGDLNWEWNGKCKEE